MARDPCCLWARAQGGTVRRSARGEKSAMNRGRPHLAAMPARRCTIGQGRSRSATRSRSCGGNRRFLRGALAARRASESALSLASVAEGKIGRSSAACFRLHQRLMAPLAPDAGRRSADRGDRLARSTQAQDRVSSTVLRFPGAGRRSRTGRLPNSAIQQNVVDGSQHKTDQGTTAFREGERQPQEIAHGWPLPILIIADELSAMADSANWRNVGKR